jgi:hypothetical protein
VVEQQGRDLLLLDARDDADVPGDEAVLRVADRRRTDRAVVDPAQQRGIVAAGRHGDLVGADVAVFEVERAAVAHLVGAAQVVDLDGDRGLPAVARAHARDQDRFGRRKARDHALIGILLAHDREALVVPDLDEHHVVRACRDFPAGARLVALEVGDDVVLGLALVPAGDDLVDPGALA